MTDSRRAKKTFIFTFVRNSTTTSDDAILSAEIRWTAFLASCDLAISISEEVQALFNATFPDSKIVQTFLAEELKLLISLLTALGHIFTITLWSN